MKRTRSSDSKDGDDHDDHEKDIIIQNLKQKLLEAEGKVESLSSFSLHQNQIDHDLFQSSYCDPLIHYELKAANDRHNYMVKKVYELEKLLAKEAATLPPAMHQQQQQHLERIKKLTDDLADLKAEKGKLLNRVESTHQFIEFLQKELVDTKKKNKDLEEENNKLNSQLFLIQQFQHASQPNTTTSHFTDQQHDFQYQSDEIPASNPNDDYNPFEHEDRSDSPVLQADD